MVAASVPHLGFTNNGPEKVLTRLIPTSAEELGCVGLGTWQSFDVGDSEDARRPLRKVLQLLVNSGASLVDSSPMYGSSERVVGELSKELDIGNGLFRATKVWTSGREAGETQMQRSLARMQTPVMDLMQIHNLLDWRTQLKTLYEWREQGRIRYIGVTHYRDSAHSELESIVRRENIDFLQVNYSMAELAASERLLPAAREAGVAVLVNRPYAAGSLFTRVRGKALPDWAEELDCDSWGQFFLKFLLANPAVTAVIPGTSKPEHMLDNLGAGFGRLPGVRQRQKMLSYIREL